MKDFCINFKQFLRSSQYIQEFGIIDIKSESDELLISTNVSIVSILSRFQKPCVQFDEEWWKTEILDFYHIALLSRTVTIVGKL